MFGKIGSERSNHSAMSTRQCNECQFLAPKKKLYGSKPKKLAATRLRSVGQSAICNFCFLSIFDISLDVSSRKSVYIRDGRVKIRQSVLKIYPHMP